MRRHLLAVTFGVIACVGGGSASLAAQPADLVAAWSFDDGSGSTLLDGSGNGNNGTLSGPLWNAQGKFGGALSFDGVDDWVTVSDSSSLDLTTAMTVEAWVYPTISQDGWRTIVQKQVDAYFLHASTHIAPLRGAGGGTVAGGAVFALAPASIPAATWTHLAITFDGSAFRLYVNGSQVSTLSSVGSLETNTNPLRIGGNSIYGEYFNGRIDEVRIYRRALTAAEIQSDMIAPVGSQPTDTTPPTVSITAPLPDATVSGLVSVTAAATDDVGVAGVQFILDGNNLAAEDTTVPYSLNWDATTVVNGAHTLRARARDLAGNTSTSAPITVFVVSPPVLIITQPAEGQTFTNTTVIDVSYTAQGDLSDVNHVHFQLDTRPEVMDMDFDGFIQFTNVGAGPHVVRGYLVRGDHTKIEGTDESVSFSTTVPDLVPPTVAMTAPANGSVVSDTITLAADATDDTGVAGVQFRLDGAAFGAEDRFSPYSLPLNTATIANGAHSVSAVVRDLAGNSVESQVVSFTVSNLNPNDPAVIGQWGGPYQWPFVAIHMTLLPSGEVLGWDDHTENQGMYLWNPSTAAFVTFPPHSVNLFCSGHTALPDGKILITGGMGVTFNIGIRNTGLYDPQLRTLSATGSMRYARYYPTVISLSDGRCLVLSGTDGCGTCVQEIPEIFNPSTGAWTELPAAGINIPYYPHVFLLPNGRILTCGTSEASVPTRVLDLATQSWTVLDSSSESGGSAAMFLPGRILRSGRANPPGIDEAASAATQVMDATVPSPVWRTTTPMAFPRTHHNLTILPDGTVLVTGGGRNSAASAIDEAVHEAEVWSPGTEAWSTLAAMQTPRLYHGTSLLLPDGRVLVAGSGRPTGFGGVDQFSAEIYSPPYLFRGPRPVIDSSPVAVPHGTSFFVGTPDASRISKISLVRLGSVTHAFNQDQRYLPLTFQPAAGGLTVQAPVDPRVAPPGYYMLFLVDNVGVPSLSAMVRMSTAVEDLTPPSAPGTPAAVVATGSVSLSWTAASDNVAVVNYHVHRSTTPGFAASGANRIAETPSTAFTDLGIQASGFYYYRITALDAAGNVGPPSGEREVAPVPDTTPPSVPQNPVLTVISPNRIDLSWDASSDDLGVAGYRVFRDSVQIASVSNVSFSDVTVSPLTTYAYSITAFDSAGNSSQPSVSVNATTPSASSGLVAAYGFNEGGGATVTDASGNGNTGTISGATWSAQGKSGGALSFDGASSLVVINDSSSLDLTTGMTLEAWVFPEASQSGWRTVIQKEVDTYLLHAGSVSPLVPATGATYSGDVTWIAGSGSIAVGQWTHLAGTYDGTRVRLYVNGVEVASAARTGLISVNDLPVRIGGNSPYGEHFDGLIDEVRIYNRALSATEIQSDMNPNTAAPVLTAPGNQISVVGNAVSRQMQATDPNGDLLTWSASGLPPGLSIDPSTGLISGIPTTVGVYSSTVTVTDGNTAPVSRGFTWTINNVLTLQPLAGSAVVAGSSIVLTAQSAGGLNPQFSWNFDDGTPDTVFSSSPTVSHTFTNPGRYLVTVTARDDTGREVTSRYRQAIHAPLTASRPTASSSIAYEDRTGANDRLWVVNPDNDSVTVFDAVTRARLAEVNVGRAPRTLAIGPDGRVWVVNAESATITILTSTFSLSQTVNLPRGSRPYGVVFDPAGVNAYVALEDGGRILKLNPANGATAASLDVGLHVRHLSVTADGALILASRFVSPRLPGEETASPQTTVGGVKHGGEVLAISAGTFTVDETVVLEHSEAPDLAISAKGIPNYLGAAVISPDGLSAWVPSKQDNIKRGALRNGGPLTHDMTMRSIVSRIVLASQSEDITGRIDFDNAGIGSASAFDAKGVFLFTALEGSREIAVVDAWAKQEVLRFDAGRAPQGLVLAPDGRALFVHNFMDRTVTLHDLNGLANGADGQPPAPVVLNCVTTEKLTPQVLVGKQLFYDASDRRLAFERYISCAGCHNDGGQDGRIWDFTQFGEGLRNTIALRGRGGVAHGPLHWTGNFDEVQDFEGQIRNFALGTGLMSDTDFHAGTRSQPLGDPKSGLSADLDALAAYVSSLTAHGDSPDRNADGSFTSAALAGQAVFQQQNCAQCHAGSKFTDSALNVFHDVGTLKPSSGQRLGAALPGMDTPTVLGLWGTAPYLHDGSAATLEEAVSAHNGVALNAADLSNLVAFLLQLDDTGTAAPAIVTWASPAAITYGTALSGTQLNATANTPGTFDYAPPAGTVLSAGNGQTLSVTFTPTDTANYGPATATVAINVLKAPLAITADDKSRPYGQPNPPFTAAYTGFVNGDTAASLDSPVVLNTTANQSSPEGTYSIVASGAADANYAVTFINGTLTVTAPVGTPGLVAAYGFNEGAGATVTDASGNSNTGTISGATWTTQGRSGGALSFNGASSLVVINDSSSLDLTTGMTLEAWVFPAVSQDGWRTVIQKEVDTYLLHAGSILPLMPAFGATYGGGVDWIPGTGSIAVGQWTHLAGTYDGARLRLYVNGLEVASVARTGSIDVNNLPVRIGGNSPYGEHFNGRIDEVRIYNRALSGTEIQSDMNLPVGGSPPPNTAPTISDIVNQVIGEDAATGALGFTVGDAETAAGTLTVTGGSGNTTLVPNGNIVFGGSGANRTVTVMPAANQSGSATITVNVSDGVLTANDAFVVTVNAVNDTPTISNVADQSTTMNTATAAIGFTVGDVETAVGSLTVGGSSGNTTLVPNANIVFGGSGASRTVTVTPAAGQTGSAAITVTVSDGALTASDSFVLTVTAVNTAPTISDIINRTINEDAGSGAIAFVVGDAETPAGSLTVTGSSGNTTLVPNGNIVFGGSGANRTVTVTPAANQSGSATITVTASDGALTASDSFVLTVTAVNDGPTISNIADQLISINTATVAIPFTVGDVETASGSLTVSASSGNTTLVPNANVVFGGSGANRTVTVTPAANQSGTATITVTVSDGTLTGSDTFLLTVNALSSGGLVAAYGFNEGAGATVTDASGNSNSGIINAATWTTQGRSGGALSFNGASSLVAINDSSSLDLTTGMTLEAWVFPAVSQDGWRTVIQKEVDTYLLHAGSILPLMPATGATYGGGVDWIPGTGSIAVGQWTHLAGTYDGVRLRLYVNGLEVASVARTGSIDVNNLPVRIGGNSPYGEYFNGRIDEVRIYNRALSGSQIQSDMNLPVGSGPAPTAVPISHPVKIASAALNSRGSIVLTVTDESFQSFALEASNDLVNWTQIAVTENSPGGAIFGDAASSPTRFYRVLGAPTSLIHSR